MSHSVLVFVEQREGAVKKSSFEALALGRRLAGEGGGRMAAVVVGKDPAALAAAAGARGAATVYAAGGDGFDLYSTGICAAATARAAERSGATILVFSATAMGKDLAPRVAVRLDHAYLADVVEAGIAGGTLTVSRPQYAGKAVWKLECPADKVVLTARPNVFSAEAPGDGSPEVVALDVSDVTPRAKVTRFHAAASEMVDVAEADIIVSGGRGLKGPENFPLVFDLARQLGAGVGASRAVVDAGWIDHDHQVGQTGKTVSPNLYVALGISGAIQHLAGMRTSKCIVAVNKDPDAPIFKVADYGVVGDVFEVVPKITEAVGRVKNG